jgi:hypothetical protein
MGVIKMALTGPPAKGIKHGRTASADWTDVDNVPYDGPAPELPKTCGRKRWHEQVTAWWVEIRRMPHCRLWTETDWRFALETAYMKQQFWLELADGDMKSTTATELRRREDQMGTTGEARRRLRIRYVDPAVTDDVDGDDDGAVEVIEQDVAGGGGKVTSLNSRRNRLAG